MLRLRNRKPPVPLPSSNRTLAARIADPHAADPPFGAQHSLAIRLAVVPKRILPLAGNARSRLLRFPAPAHLQNRNIAIIPSHPPSAAHASIARSPGPHTHTRAPARPGLPCQPLSE